MSLPNEQLWIIGLERQSKKDFHLKFDLVQEICYTSLFGIWATSSTQQQEHKLHSLVLLPSKATLSSLLTSSFSIFWLPRNFSSKKWQSGQIRVGTVCYQSRSGELSDHKRQQNKLRSHQPNHGAGWRNAVVGEGEGRTCNFAKYSFSDVTHFLEWPKAGVGEHLLILTVSFYSHPVQIQSHVQRC